MNIRFDSFYPQPSGMSDKAFERLVVHLHSLEAKMLCRARYRCLRGIYDGNIVQLTLKDLIRKRYVFLAEREYFWDSAKLLRSIFVRNAERDLGRRHKRNLLTLDHPQLAEPAAPRESDPLNLVLEAVVSPATVIQALLAERVDSVTAHAWAWFKIEGISWQEVGERLAERVRVVPEETALRKRAERLSKNAAVMRGVLARVLGEDFLPPSETEQSKRGTRSNRRKSDFPAVRFLLCA